MILRSAQVRHNIRLNKLYKLIHRQYATPSNALSVKRTRNIGIIAHIDAGKTTTTERMLFYAGFTRQLGDVDQGSTVTDFLPAERARGITIQSAAITFSWPPEGIPVPRTDSKDSKSPRLSFSPTTINLIDTPGHADFTFEVIRSLRVLDGAVCILDGVAGVEAQTEKVWQQAQRQNIPTIIFVNKLDRDGASFAQTVKQAASKFRFEPAICTIPWWDGQGRLRGVGDVINMRAISYPTGSDGKNVQAYDLAALKSLDDSFAQELQTARFSLIDVVGGNDVEFLENVLGDDFDYDRVAPDDLLRSMRSLLCNGLTRSVVPVFAGASFRNVGVQPLLDGIVDILPDPRPERGQEISLESEGYKFVLAESDGGRKSLEPAEQSVAKYDPKLDLQALEACALAFKVVNDPRRGVLVYVRVYSGAIKRNAFMWNTNLQTGERAHRLLRMYANDAIDIDEISVGQIGVIPGLKYTRTGDSLVIHAKANPKRGPPGAAAQLQLKPIEVPPPVFFVSVEPNSLAEERHVKESLDLLLREDPSLSVTVDEESGQTQLAGMGELHLEIAQDRLMQDFKAKAQVGSIEISYREAISTPSGPVEGLYDREIAGKVSKASCTAEVAPTPEIVPTTAVKLAENNILVVNIAERAEDTGRESTSLPTTVVRHALQDGVLAAMARGPSLGYPVHSTQVTINFDLATDVFASTTAGSISSVARLAVSKAMQASAAIQPVSLMEPVMRVAISVDESSLGTVMQDISSARGGSILDLDADDGSAELADNSQWRPDVSRIYVPPDPFAGSGIAQSDVSERKMRTFIARVPLKEMVGYLKHLRSMTGGRGTFTMTVDKFEKMGAQRVKGMQGALRGDSY